jgi:hypothetical protein
MSQSRVEKMVVIDIGRTLVKSTDKAVCLIVNEQKKWFPKQSIRYSLEKGKMELPYWMAKDKECLSNTTNTVTLSHQLVPSARVQSKPVTVTSVTSKLSLLEEFAKLSAEVKLMNQRLIAIHHELTKGEHHV